jgi:hypothetical protein
MYVRTEVTLGTDVEKFSSGTGSVSGHGSRHLGASLAGGARTNSRLLERLRLISAIV